LAEHGTAGQGHNGGADVAPDLAPDVAPDLAPDLARSNAALLEILLPFATPPSQIQRDRALPSL
jgi:hypothetical protein